MILILKLMFIFCFQTFVIFQRDQQQTGVYIGKVLEKKESENKAGVSMLKTKVYLLREKPRRTYTDHISWTDSPGSTRKRYKKDVGRFKKAKMPQRSSSRVASSSKITLTSPRMKKPNQHKNFSIVKAQDSVGNQTRFSSLQKFPTLTRTMLNEVSSVWDKKKTTETLVNNFDDAISVADLKTLSNSEWLNNNIINFYMSLIVKRSEREQLPKVYFMNTFFYPKLKKDGYNSIKRWTKMVDIFVYDLVIVPIFLSAHWSLAIINFQDKSIRLYDSMSLTSNKKCLDLLKEYLNKESLDKKQKPYDASDWKLESVKNIPQQQNLNDCGVFVCTFAEYLAANRKFNFTQKDIDYFRKKITYEILHSKLLNFNVKK